jgi:S-methylmethionine-dependent homocysteine/selenocysteine methylase
MSKYRNNLPQLADRLFLTDGGLETTLIFHEGVELPHFASFDLMKSRTGVAKLRAYYARYITMAKEHRLGFILESHTWRANRDWAAKLGYAAADLAEANRAAIALMADLRDKYETPQTPIVISGNIGPRGDGYKIEHAMRAKEAADYHGEQIAVFAKTQADMVSAFTLNYVEEAIGVARAAKKAAMPVVISFTVETDGKLPSGQSLKDAIEQTDHDTSNAPAYYMLNCAHPTHFSDALKRGEAGSEPWVSRLRGIRANASTRSHAELDAAPDLDIGDPAALGRHYRDLCARFRHVNVLGGCCGTDHRHVGEICASCVEVAA